MITLKLSKNVTYSERHWYDCALIRQLNVNNDTTLISKWRYIAREQNDEEISIPQW
jgi:hypothetical protein